MNVSLTPELEQMIHDRVDSGRYASASEVVREALRILSDRETKIEKLKRELQIGIDQIATGETVEYTPKLMKSIEKEAQDRIRLGNPVKDVVKL